MRIEFLPVHQAIGHLLLHNIVDATGKRLIRKGVRLTEKHLDQLQALGQESVEVAILQAGDVWEDDAARQLADALQSATLELSWGVGGRVNFHTTVSGVLYVDAARLERLNTLAGVTLATLPQHSVVHPRYSPDQTQIGKGDQVATLKIIPYALPQALFEQALQLVTEVPLLDVRPLPALRVALLIIGDPAAHRQLQHQFEAQIKQRVEALHSELSETRLIHYAEATIIEAVEDLLAQSDLLILAGQTSIMDMEDMVLRALRRAGAKDVMHGAPVDPGNLLALAYLHEKTILCAPGCVRSPARNVVDLVLPRLLVGERMQQGDLVRLGLGGLLH